MFIMVGMIQRFRLCFSIFLYTLFPSIPTTTLSPSLYAPPSLPNSLSNTQLGESSDLAGLVEESHSGRPVCTPS